MFYIVLALVLFAALVAAHIFFCRKANRPGLQAKAFGFMAIIFLGFYVTGVSVGPCSVMFDPQGLWGLPFKITAGIIFFLLVPVYLCFYVLTQLTSPSGKILLAISQRGELSRADILACVQSEDFITSRLNDLCTSGCVRQIEDRYILTAEGRKIAGILNLLQLVLGRDVGG